MAQPQIHVYENSLPIQHYIGYGKQEDWDVCLVFRRRGVCGLLASDRLDISVAVQEIFAKKLKVYVVGLADNLVLIDKKKQPKKG